MPQSPLARCTMTGQTYIPVHRAWGRIAVRQVTTMQPLAEPVSNLIDAFCKLPGIGPKTAKLIVVQLAGKLHASPRAATGAGAPAATAVAAQVVAALVALGWSERVSTETVHAIVADASASDRAAVPALLKLALAQLGPSSTERASV